MKRKKRLGKVKAKVKLLSETVAGGDEFVVATSHMLF